MLGLIRYLLLFAIIAYGLWPYYHVFRLDTVLGEEDPTGLEDLVDLAAIQRNYKERLSTGLGGLMPSPGGDMAPSMQRLARGLDRLGEAALDQYVTLAWAQETLRDAAREATEQSPAYLISAVSFAFFESYDRFLIRLGELGEGPTHIRMRLDGMTWRVTDIIR